MYNPHSLRAEEFINHAEIMDTLEYARAHKDDKTLLSEILAKAALRKGLNHREAAVLLLCEDETVTEQMNRLARQIKLDFYGSRICPTTASTDVPIVRIMPRTSIFPGKS